MHCPKCGWEQDEGKADCARCGIIFAKMHRSPAPPVMPRSPGQDSTRPRVVEEWLLITEDSVNPFYFAGRVLVFLFLLVFSF